MTRQRFRSTFIAVMTAVLCAFSIAAAQIRIVVNNVGYERSGTKKAIVMSASAASSASILTAEVIDAGGAVVHTAGYSPNLAVESAQWNVDGYRYFAAVDFSDFNQIGDGYKIRIGTVTSPPFSIGDKILQTKSGADQINFFYTMRHGHHADRASFENIDRNLPIFGSDRTINISGGWWDATGDPGKHLSHLAYSNYFTPQQIPMVVWALLHAHELQPDAYEAALEEAAWGADYLLRALAPEGYFYMSVFDNWGDEYRYVSSDEQGSGTRGGREVCSWGSFDGREPSDMDATMNSRGFRSADYQSAMREGAGVSIAALARAYKAGVSGDSGAAQYLAGAVRAYRHLKDNPTRYQDDGRQNIIDYYCGLLAASELYNATGEYGYAADAFEWSNKLLSLQSADGWFYSGRNDAGDLYRPFFHAAEEGLPVVALSRYYKTCAGGGNGAAVREAVAKNLRWYHKLTYNGAHGSNPFEYARMYRAESEPLGSGGDGGGGPRDLARGKPAEASREEASGSGCPGGCLASHAFDGDQSTRWSSYSSNEPNDSQWISVDLGQVYLIDRVVLNWETARGKHYRIEVSSNRTAWVPVFEITDNAVANQRLTHAFDPVEARYVRMFGVERGLEHGGFSLYDFEVYGEDVIDDTNPPSPYRAHFFIPKVNETGYWWQGENARLASMASAFVIGAPIADPTGKMWEDTLFGMATAQLDWILGRNPFNVTMMYGYGNGGEGEDYPHYPATRSIPNIRGGICNGISSARANENDIEWIPYEGESFWRNWRYIEQWLPHNAWYLIAVSSLAYRMDNDIADEQVSVNRAARKIAARTRVFASRGRNLRVELPLAAGRETEIAMYDMRGRKVFAHAVSPGVRSVSVRIPASVARGTYIVSVRDMSGTNKYADKIHLR